MKLRPFGALPPFRALSPEDWLCCDLPALTFPASEEFNQEEYVWPYIRQKVEGVHEEACPKIPSLGSKSWQKLLLSQLYVFDTGYIDPTLWALAQC